MHTTLPTSGEQALLIGRLWQAATGPVLVAVTPEHVWDLSPLAPTCSALLELDQAANRVQAFLASGQAPRSAHTPEVLAPTQAATRAAPTPHFLAPCAFPAATAAGAALSPDQQEAIIAGGLLVAGLLGAALPDREKRP